jgi:hypothetical protein
VIESTADVTTTFFDAEGRAVWVKDAGKQKGRIYFHLLYGLAETIHAPADSFRNRPRDDLRI